MNEDQITAIAAAIVAEIVAKCLEAFTQRRERRRPYSWLHARLEEIAADGVRQVRELCLQVREMQP